MSYIPTIGLEIHAELKTRTKMFCDSPNDPFNADPNTNICPVCLAHPGTLPVINREAVKHVLRVGLALNGKLADYTEFDRKTYFYPDLPKGYQISQYEYPLVRGGELNSIAVTRVHLEEDTGKLTHVGSETLIDFNRSGVPLVEIVTEPDFHSSAQVKDYAKKLQQIFRYLGVSNADMERGDMRLEANVSVRPVGQKELPPYRVELKNINSFRFMQAAIEYEIKRQIWVLERGETLTQETRGWNETKKETYLQRSKEEAHDYRYFPEPDLPELKIDTLQLRELLRKQLPELPAQKVKRFFDEYGLNKAQIAMMADSKEMAEFFEEAVKVGSKYKVESIKVANFIINKKVNIEDINPEQLIKDIVNQNTGMISDEKELEKVVKEVIDENSKAVEDFKAGKEVALQVIIGSVMKKTKGKAEIKKVKEILEGVLKS